MDLQEAARWRMVNNLLKARTALREARECMGVVKPGGGSISDLGAIQDDLKAMDAMCKEMWEARER